MSRPKGSKNKNSQEKEKRYAGYFIMESGLKLKFDISEENGGDDFEAMLVSEYPFDESELVWLGETDDCFIRAKKIIGFYIYDYLLD